MKRFLIWTFVLVVFPAANGEGTNGNFVLPNLSRGDPPKPTISPDLAHYFQLPDAGARRFVGSYFPGLVPPPNFEVVDPQQQLAIRSAEQAGFGILTAGNSPGSPQAPGLSNALANNALQALLGGGNAFSPGFQLKPTVRISSGGNSTNDTASGNETASGQSQIAGIPKIFPTLPKAPVAQVPVPSLAIPSLPTRPEVPQGGLGPLAAFAQQAANNGFQSSPPNSPFLPGSGLQVPVPNGPIAPTAFATQQQQQSAAAAAAAALYPQAGVSNENLLAQLMRTFGLQSLAPNVDLNAVNNALGLQNNQNNAGLLSNVVYSALTDSGNAKLPNNNAAATAVVGNATDFVNNKANAALIQNLITQPNSPFCNPKPRPVDNFDVNAFMGKWYQVLYSPPLSAGPCSMITYQKLADVAQGGPGTVFDTFEYTTESTPYGKPRVSSGYGIIRGRGQLIYRTTNSPSDVNVYVLETGPTNELGQYEYVVLAVNCNYPLHVFARDPVQYKQKYEAEVNAALEQRSLVTSWSRLLNLVAPVDYNLCTFPPTLFNVRG